jgi:hypothetical protein
MENVNIKIFQHDSFMVLVCHLTWDQNLEETVNEKCIFKSTTTTKLTTNDESNLNLIGKRAEERLTGTKTMASEG